MPCLPKKFLGNKHRWKRCRHPYPEPAHSRNFQCKGNHLFCKTFRSHWAYSKWNHFLHFASVPQKFNLHILLPDLSHLIDQGKSLCILLVTLIVKSILNCRSQMRNRLQNGSTSWLVFFLIWLKIFILLTLLHYSYRFPVLMTPGFSGLCLFPLELKSIDKDDDFSTFGSILFSDSGSVFPVLTFILLSRYPLKLLTSAPVIP